MGIVVFEGSGENMMKVSKNLIFLAIFVCVFGNFGALGFKFNPKEISRLVATVDPKTCNCVTQQHCNINIPYTSLLQIKCHEGTQLCCHGRERIKPFVTAKDFAEIVAAAKRFNIDLKEKAKSIVPMVANADPKEVASTVEKLKEVEMELVKVEQSTLATPNEDAKVENQVRTKYIQPFMIYMLYF